MSVNNNFSRHELSQYVISSLGLRSKSSINASTVQMQFHCPFHTDRTPSMSINLSQGIYHCFSCSKGGSIESLYRDITGNNLTKVLGIPKDSFSTYAFANTYRVALDDSLSLKNVYINIDWSNFEDSYSNALSKQYLIDRGISKEVATSMNFKYTEKAYINNTLFLRRLVIPVYENNRLIAVEGRKILPEDPGPKVLYCKNGTVNSLFDIDKLDKSKALYVVEGLMDLAVLRQHPFFQNSTSIFGANLTKRQLDLLSKFNRIIVIPDNDAAGDKTLDQLRTSGLDNVFYLKLPKELNSFPVKDVGDLPKAGLSVDYLLRRKWTNYIRKLS